MRPLKVLIVDDELLLLLDLENLIEGLGHEVITATNGNQASALYRDHPDIDAVISDIRMPHGDGLFLLQYAKRQERRKPPFLMHSSENFYQPLESGREYDLRKIIPEDFTFARFYPKSVAARDYIINFLREVAKDKVA